MLKGIGTLCSPHTLHLLASPSCYVAISLGPLRWQDARAFGGFAFRVKAFFRDNSMPLEPPKVVEFHCDKGKEWDIVIHEGIYILIIFLLLTPPMQPGGPPDTFLEKLRSLKGMEVRGLWSERRGGIYHDDDDIFKSLLLPSHSPLVSFPTALSPAAPQEVSELDKARLQRKGLRLPEKKRPSIQVGGDSRIYAIKIANRIKGSNKPYAVNSHI